MKCLERLPPLPPFRFMKRRSRLTGLCVIRRQALLYFRRPHQTLRSRSPSGMFCPSKRSIYSSPESLDVSESVPLLTPSGYPVAYDWVCSCFDWSIIFPCAIVSAWEGDHMSPEAATNVCWRSSVVRLGASAPAQREFSTRSRGTCTHHWRGGGRGRGDEGRV